MNVEIEIPVTQLKSVLPGLGKVVLRSTSLPVLQCVKVALSQDEKTIELQAHNLDEVATVRLDNKANGLSGQLLVPLDMLAKIVKGCTPGQSIRLIGTKEETKIRYTVAGSAVDRLVSHIPAAEWPEVKGISQEPVLLDEAFKVALKEATECCSEDSSRYVLNGACLDTRHKGAHYVVGTDGRHLYSANTFQFNLPEPLIVPTCKFLSWAGFAENGPWKLSMLPAVRTKPEEKKKDSPPDEPPWFRIDSNNWSYVARAIDGQYPNWKQVLPESTDSWTQIVLHAQAVDTLLEALPLLPGGDETNRSITLAAGNGLVLQAKGRDETDWTSINVPEVTVTGKSVETTLNRSFLLQALRFGLHHIAIQSSLEPLVFSSPGKMMIVMPLRGEGPVKTTPAQPEKSPTTENASAATPSATVAINQTEERKDMSTPTMTAPERGNVRANNGTNGQTENEETRSAFKTALEQIDRIKTNLRDVIGDLSDAVSMLKTAEKEQRASVKEIQTVRAKLREIQSVEI